MPRSKGFRWDRVWAWASGWSEALRPRVPPFFQPLVEVPVQIWSVRRLSLASEAMEVEDYPAARELFMAVVATDLPLPTRLLAYQGAVVALLRLGEYQSALQIASDADVLLSVSIAGEGDPDAEEIRRSLDEASRFARWALEHPGRAEDLRERESWLSETGVQREEEEEAAPLGSATGWPLPVRVGYRTALLGLLAAGLAVAAVDQGRSAVRLLRMARLAARFDKRIERDICWHLARLQERLGQTDDAAEDQQRYEVLNQQVRRELLRRRWTN